MYKKNTNFDFCLYPPSFRKFREFCPPNFPKFPKFPEISRNFPKFPEIPEIFVPRGKNISGPRRHFAHISQNGDISEKSRMHFGKIRLFSRIPDFFQNRQFFSKKCTFLFVESASGCTQSPRNLTFAGPPWHFENFGNFGPRNFPEISGNFRKSKVWGKKAKLGER